MAACKKALLLNHVNMLVCRVPESDVEKKGQGYVLSADPGVAVSARAHKMSKSRGNVVNPDDVVDAYGADSLRLYEMFMGPLRDTKVGSLFFKFQLTEVCSNSRWIDPSTWSVRSVSEAGICVTAISCHLLHLRSNKGMIWQHVQRKSLPAALAFCVPPVASSALTSTLCGELHLVGSHPFSKISSPWCACRCGTRAASTACTASWRACSACAPAS